MKYRIPFLKRLIPSIRRRIARYTWKDGTKIITRGSVQFRLSYRNFVDRQVAFYGDFERKQVAYLRAAMTQSGCDVFVDIGANFGFYALPIAADGLAQSVIAVEPDPRNFNRLASNIALNGLAHMIDAYPFVAASEPGQARLEMAPSNSTGQTKVANDGSSDSRGLIVKAVRLDDLLDYTGKNIFLKIDVEGYEVEVLDGLKRTLTNNSCFLQVESYRENVDVLKSIMDAAGYRFDHQIDHDFYFSNLED